MWEPEKFPSSSSARLIEPYTSKNDRWSESVLETKKKNLIHQSKKREEPRINLGIHLLNRNRNLAEEFHVSQIYFPNHFISEIMNNVHIRFLVN